MPFGPGADAALAFLTTLHTSFQEGSFVSNGVVGHETSSILSHGSKGFHCCLSPCVSKRCFSTSSFVHISLPDHFPSNTVLVNLYGFATNAARLLDLSFRAFFILSAFWRPLIFPSEYFLTDLTRSFPFHLPIYTAWLVPLVPL